MYKLGVDIGGTKINIGLFDEVGNLISNKKIFIKDITSISSSIKEISYKLAAEANILFSDIQTCGIGVPGTVSDDGKTILKAPNISKLHTNIADEVERELNVPTALVQDSRAAAWGEYLYGAGQGKESVVCITLGTGIGCGIVLNGKIFNGSLGCAGEIGHIPVVQNGRECGCGRRGCVEKYCAGGGLDITAKEILGNDKVSVDLFNEAKRGNLDAVKAIEETVSMLGNVVVSIINIISPDSILLSGGLSKQLDLYINPVIDYVKNHCYDAGRIPDIKVAALGENSPLYGAAYIPIAPKRKPLLSASIMCADILNMDSAMKEIEDAGIEYLHCDIMDNHFVPNLMLPMELLNKLKTATTLPFDYHIMAEKPETIIEKLDIRNGDIISIHYECTVHIQRVVSLIKEKGAKAAIAINPGTPIDVLSEILPELDMVLIMTVNPGFAGQKIVQSSFGKIRKIRNALKERSLENILIQVDGNCSFENVPKMYEAGADIFVVGTSSVFKKGLTIKEGTEKLLSLL